MSRDAAEDDVAGHGIAAVTVVTVPFADDFTGSKLEVIADDIELMSRGQQQGGGAQAPRQQPPAADVYDDDIPF